MTDGPPRARFGRWLVVDLREVVDPTNDPSRLERGGWWVLVGTFERRITGYRFGTVSKVPAGRPHGTGVWPGWSSRCARCLPPVAAGPTSWPRRFRPDQ